MRINHLKTFKKPWIFEGPNVLYNYIIHAAYTGRTIYKYIQSFKSGELIKTL